MQYYGRDYDPLIVSVSLGYTLKTHISGTSYEKLCLRHSDGGGMFFSCLDTSQLSAATRVARSLSSFFRLVRLRAGSVIVGFAFLHFPLCFPLLTVLS